MGGSFSSSHDNLDFAKEWARKDSLGLSELNHSDHFEMRGEQKFLNAYSPKDLMSLFDRFLWPGLEEEFKDRQDFRFSCDTTDPFAHCLTISHARLARLTQGGQFLLKMFVRRMEAFDWKAMRVLQPTNRCVAFDNWLLSLPTEEDRDLHNLGAVELPHALNFTEIEYVYLQNPLKKDFDRPRLPNQKYPGLGVGVEFISLIQSAATSKQRDSVFNYPECFHNALIYFRARMRFLSPHCEAFFQCILMDLASDLKKDFAGVAWAVHDQRLYFGDSIVVWPLWEQILPTSPHMKTFMEAHAAKVKDLIQLSGANRPKFRIVDAKCK